MDGHKFSNDMSPQPNDELNWLSPENLDLSPQNCIHPPNFRMHQESQQTQQMFLSSPTSYFPQQMDGYEAIQVTDHDNYLPHPQNMNLNIEDWIHIPNVKAQRLLKSQKALKECYKDQPQEIYGHEIQPPTEVASHQGKQLSIMEVFNHVPQVTDYFNDLDWTHLVEVELQQLPELFNDYY
ncbi:hypothetical protein RIF29_08449 [Crotalaria pallida]|uniref:Uncharacterized protein n=1 Tax=Crotalaria pallida TaxID=3830 RepID=A0AAN9FTH7_CROPI